MTIPIYIIARDQITPLKAMCEWFSNIRGVEPIIVDNASTYGPLLDWYRDCPFKVIQLDANYGHHSPWERGAVMWASSHRAYFGSDFYCVTDPDLDFTGCPWDLIDECIDGFHAVPAAIKVGIGLRIDDIPEHSRVRVQRHEGDYWKRPVNDRYFEAQVDTTFAVYRASTPHQTAMAMGTRMLRTRPPYTARHLPWYWTKDSLTEEQRYYFEHANSSNSWKPT